MSQRLAPSPHVFATALCCAISVSAAEGATVEPRRSYRLPAGDAAATLNQFASASGQQIVFMMDKVKGERTNAIAGDFTAHEALSRMLAGTGLEAARDPATGAFVVSRRRSANSGRAAARTDLTRAPPATASPPAEPATTQSKSNTPSSVKSRNILTLFAAVFAAAFSADAQTSPTPPKDETIQLGTFEVFGSKLINADLPRTRDNVQPYVVFGREQIETSNATNLDEFFRTRLPMNNSSAEVPSSQSTPINTSSISLRGLNAFQTLILIDGRRATQAAGSAAGGSISQADINGIPLSMIERIEILPSTSSGIYGGGATGGVINIITRKDFSGVEATLSYSNPFDTDAAQRRVDINGSLSLEGGKTQLTFSSTYSTKNMMMVQDRDFTVRSRALQRANNPAAFTAASTPPLGYTPNIRSSTGANLVLKPQYGGTVLNSPFTTLPVGYAGVAVSGVGPLVANAGTYNYDLPDSYSNGLRSPLGNESELRSFSVGARRRFGAKVEAFVDLMSQDNLSQIPSVFVSNTTTLPATAPNNPFTVPVRVVWPVTALSGPFPSQSRNRRATAGIVVRLPKEWTAGLDYTWSRSISGTQSPLNFVGDPDGTGPLPSFATALSNGSVDIMRDLNAYPLNYGPYRLPGRLSNTVPFELRATEWAARASGPTVSLPAGPITLSGSASFRDEAQPGYVAESFSSVPSTLSYWPPGFFETRSGYLETRVPIFPEKNTGLLRALELQGSLRWDDYRMRGRALASVVSIPSRDGPIPPIDFLHRHFKAVSETIGLKYSPLEQVALRASVGTGFLPPRLAQLSGSTPFAAELFVVDPKRGSAFASTGQILLDGSGAVDMRPEESESVSAGIILTPRVLPGFRLSVDFTRITKTDEIGALTEQQTFDLEDVVPGRIERAPLTAQDRALGYKAGQVTLVKLGSINIAGKKIAVFDIQADYEMKTAAWGRFRFYTIATCQTQLASKAAIGAPFFEGIGYTGGLRWRGNGGIDWQSGPWLATWNMQYFDSHLGYSSNSSALNRQDFILNQGTDTVPRRILHDVGLSYNFGRQPQGWRHYLSKTRITVGVQNIFNESPPIRVSTSSGSQAYYGYVDPRGARYTLSLRKTF